MIVEKALKMAGMMEIPVMALVENMSYVACPDCGKHVELFGKSHVAEIAQRYNIPLTAQLPIDPKPVSYTHLRAHETGRNLVCRLLLEKKKTHLRAHETGRNLV